MRAFSKALAALAVTAATTVSSVVATAPAAHAENCGGFPSIPAAYVCIVSVDPQAGLPTVGPGFAVTIPAVCYVLGCTTDQTETVPTVALSQQPVLVFTWNNQTYSVPGNTPLNEVLTALNAVLAQANATVFQLCATVSQKVQNFGIHLVCQTIQE